MHLYVKLKQNIDGYPLKKDDVGVIELAPDINGLTKIRFLRVNDSFVINENLYEEFAIEETGDRFDHKVCDRCYKCLPTDTHFENNRLKKDNVMTKRPSCRSCRKIKDGVSISTAERRCWETTRPEYGSLFLCPICQKNTIVGPSKIVLDHNHHTGNVRGWICESCNTGIGRFDDDPEILMHGIRWLEKHD